ncbi:MAG TPA: hypothetical protein VE960_00730, partial [bacterium]|nr:hypothetical protein [bacterium]
MQQLQDEYGEDELIVLYFHVSDTYSTPETHNRAGYYQVGGIPEVDFDGVDEVIGAGSVSGAYAIYSPIIDARLAVETPVTVRTEGVIRPAADPDSSWVTATFKAVGDVTEDDLRAYFIVYENTS